MQPDSTDPEETGLSTDPEITRREFLQQALRTDPDNTFARYGLALELARTDPAAAWSHFDYLLTRHPEYAATYYQAGVFLVGQRRPEEARRVLAAGVDVSSRQGKEHARQQLQAVLDELESTL